jgi:hypothetical protein
MRTGVGVVAAPLRATLANLTFAMVAATALLAPSLLGAGTDGPAAVTLAALALVFAAAVRLRSRSLVLVVSSGNATQPIRDGARPVLPSRVTDPIHHPLRPRAPGLD